MNPHDFIRDDALVTDVQVTPLKDGGYEILGTLTERGHQVMVEGVPDIDLPDEPDEDDEVVTAQNAAGDTVVTMTVPAGLEGTVGLVVHGVGDSADEDFEHRNTLGVALRKIVHAIDLVDPLLASSTPETDEVMTQERHDLEVFLGRLQGMAAAALEEVFPGDADGELGLYDCPTHDGREPIDNPPGFPTAPGSPSPADPVNKGPGK